MNHLTTNSGAWNQKTRVRRGISCFFVVIVVVIMGRGSFASPNDEGLMGGGGPPATAPCITDLEREQVQQVLAEWKTRHPDSTQTAAVEVPPKFTFYPMGGTLFRDVIASNFVDLNPGPGLLDWDCTAITYNGHDASDVCLRSFGEQLIGVPVFAALDGTVVDAHDGEDDMHTACSGPANYVILENAGGRVTYYWHFKRNSVQVSVSQIVRAGEQLGLAASSGCSDWPHLHFATYDNSALVEPYAGLCRPGDSEWVNQTPMNRSLYLRDLNFTTDNPALPFDSPRIGTFVTGLQTIRFWIMTGHIPAGTSYRLRFRRPDSTLAFDSGLGGLGNPFYPFSWWWWNLNVNLDQLGTWRLDVTLNGTPMASAPFEVVSTAGEIVNRPPNPITVQIEPSAPTENDVLICRVNTDLVLDDPDYDIVRYHYVWTVDSSTVRDVVTAGHADVIPHHSAGLGSEVTCTVTPGDGVADGPTTSVSVTVAQLAPPAVLPDPAGVCDGGPTPGAPCSDSGTCNGGTCKSDKLRFISFSAPGAAAAAAGDTALRVKLTLMHHVSPPYTNGPSTAFTLFEGQSMWVGPPVQYVESGSDQTQFMASKLQCDPDYRDWTTVGLLHVTGEAIVPSSTYNVENLAGTCLGVETSTPCLSGGVSVSTALTIKTGRSGDVVATFQDPTQAASQPDFDDIGALVNKFKSLVGSPIKAHAKLYGVDARGLMDLSPDVGFDDISLDVDAFKGVPYPYKPGMCTGVPATACIADADCGGNGPCILCP